MPGLIYRETLHSKASLLGVECTWSVEGHAPSSDLMVLPDGCMDLVFSEDQGLMAVGTMTRQQTFSLAAGERAVGLRFLPGHAAGMLRVRATELTDGGVSLADLLGLPARALERHLYDLGTVDARQQALADFVAAGTRPTCSLIRAFDAMTVAHGHIDLHGVARQANLSDRQFRRRCLDETGLSPKQLCRILRFRHTLGSHMQAGIPNWTDIAYAGGYYDQSHFIKDFKEFSGCSPTEYLMRTGDVRFLQSTARLED